jgi:uncharacterized protein YqgC (DUF456 family)
MIALAIAAMVLALFLTPLGAPGNWIMIAILAAGAWYDRVSWPVLFVCVAIALIAEVLEFMLVKRMSDKYGGSKKAFWGAIAGGIVGVIIGMPVPVIGSIIAGFIGSFGGAAIVTYMEAKDMGQAGRVGWGVLLGRMLAAAVKTAAGIAILVAGAAALLVP